jgi:CO dehydrogenase nickel-insertion accessory protein CooC1
VNNLKIEVKKSFLLVNRYHQGILQDRIRETNLEYLGSLSFEPQIEELGLLGRSIFDLKPDAPILAQLNSLGEKIWKHH